MVVPTLNSLRHNVAQKLADVGIVHPFEEAKSLICAALGKDPHIFITQGEVNLSENEFSAVEDFLKRRLGREPLSRIRGVREFWSLPFQLNEHTLDPRPDSETLVETLLKYIPQESTQTLLDLGTGTGCLLISLLSERPQAQGIGVDLSSEAASLAYRNAIFNDVEERSLFVTSHWGCTFKQSSFDIVLSNPPYIPKPEKVTLEPEVKDYDPDLALFGGHDGLGCYRILAPQIKQLLKKEGICALEIGAGQREGVQEIFMRECFECLQVAQDLAGHDRVLVFQK